MKRTILLFAAAFLTGVSLLAQSLADGPLAVRHLTLSNGMEVYLNEDHTTPVIYGAVVVGAGAVDCPDTGIAHYFEHIMFKGTDRIGTVDYEAEKVYLDSIETMYSRLKGTADETERKAIQQEINRISLAAADYAIPNEFTTLITQYGGTGLNAGTSYDFTVYYNTIDSRYLRPWLELTSHRFLHPVYRLFQGELETVYEEKNMGSDSMTDGVIDKAIAAFAGEDYPYAFPVIGSTENLKNPDQAAMHAFYEKYYVARNMSLLLGGDFDAATAESLLEETFGRIRAGEKPQRLEGREKPLEGISETRIKLPVPLIKGEALVFNGPLGGDPDEMACQLGTALLSNSAGTGALDSLTTARKVLAAAATSLSFNHLGASVLLDIPKVPFGSLKKSEKKILEEVRRIQEGDFSDEALAQAKRDLRKDLLRSLETLEDRGMTLLTVLSQGRSWEDFLAQIDGIDAVTREDVMAAMKKYYDTDRFLRLRKKFGSYPKDQVTKPDYKPVIPPHRREQSAYAKELEARFGGDYGRPKTLDPATPEVVRIPLNDVSTFYAAGNPVNELFQLTFNYRIGTMQDARLDLLASVLPMAGTDSLTVQELSRAWQRLGTNCSIEASANDFSITLSGFEEALPASLTLLRHFLGHVTADRETLSETVSDYNQAASLIFMDGTSAYFSALLAKAMYGDQAPLLRRLGKKEAKALGKGTELLELLDSEVLTARCDVTYSGRGDAGQIAALIRERIPIGSRDVPRGIPTFQTRENAVWLVDAPGSRQTYIAAYVTDPDAAAPDRRARMELWSEYFGGGMSAVLFEEVREYRAFAYSAHGRSQGPDVERPDDPGCFVGYLSTQADKAGEAMALLDSLFRNMPASPVNAATAKQAVINEINNGYPTFRQLPERVAALDRRHQTVNPEEAAYEALRQLTLDDIVAYGREVAGRPFLWLVVGDKKSLDLDKLAEYGPVTILKEKDLIKK